ncbi:MOSC domain-containing protein [Saliphagus sp. GCM10025317]
MAHLERLFVYPIKSLDPVSVDAAQVGESGAFEWDRRYAIVDESDAYVNGKRERAVHRLHTEYDLERKTVTIGERGGKTRTYHLDVDRDSLESWLTDFFGYRVQVVCDDEGGFPDDTDASGPTVISTGTLEAVADWYEGIDVDEMRRRLRANLEVNADEAFWEDRLYDRPGRAVAFELGDATLLGVNPCQRCVVPTRDPDTGEDTPGFRETFVERREATLPTWAGSDWFDHYFRLMVNTRVPDDQWETTLSVGDDVRLGESTRVASS